MINSYGARNLIDKISDKYFQSFCMNSGGVDVPGASIKFVLRDYTKPFLNDLGY